MSNLSLDRLEFDPSDVAEGPKVGSYIVSDSGTVIDDTAGALNVHLASGDASLDLDIRDLVNTQDSIAIGDETNLVDLAQNDAVFNTSGYGFPIYGVRQDASGSPVSADGDAHPFVFNDDGELKVAADLTSDVADDAADSGNPIKIGGRGIDQSSALSALSAANDRFDLLGDLYRRVFINDAPNVGGSNETVSVDTTVGGVALGTPSAGRTRVMIQNRGNKKIYVGFGTVSAANGIEVGKGDTLTLEAGESIALKAIADSGTQDVRVLHWG